jgi:cytochrome P450
VQLDRKPNPHVAFGFGHHLCIGAAHARLVIRSLLEACVKQVASMDVLESLPATEKEEAYERHLGFKTLRIRWHR